MDIDTYLYKTPAEVDPEAGRLLLADPRLVDISFYRSAVLILDREDTGAHLGLVLNHEKIPLFKGGPVELDRLFMLHRLGTVIDGSLEILPGIYTGGNSDQIRDYIASGGETDGLMRFFIGYSGWGAGQLTKEILENSWAVNVHPDSGGLLRGEGESYWRRQVEDLGPEFRSWLSIPAHPSLN